MVTVFSVIKNLCALCLGEQCGLNVSEDASSHIYFFSCGLIAQFGNFHSSMHLLILFLSIK